LEKKTFFVHPPDDQGPLSGSLVILWHGAGGDVDEKSLLALARAFAKKGATAARARFAYRVAGRRAPDRMPALINSARTTIAAIRDLAGAHDDRLVLGGRSMGGRVASMLAAEGDPVDGLLFLAYPLHPEGQTDKLRDEHLYKLSCPMLFVQGDKDALAEMRFLKPVFEKLGDTATVKLFEGADHSLRRAPLEQVIDASLSWTEAKVRARARKNAKKSR
jgi:predicted alpha/beta-hydrolase family hydrolase